MHAKADTLFEVKTPEPDAMIEADVPALEQEQPDLTEPDAADEKLAAALLEVEETGRRPNLERRSLIIAWCLAVLGHGLLLWGAYAWIRQHYIPPSVRFAAGHRGGDGSIVPGEDASGDGTLAALTMGATLPPMQAKAPILGALHLPDVADPANPPEPPPVQHEDLLALVDPPPAETPFGVPTIGGQSSAPRPHPPTTQFSRGGGAGIHSPTTGPTTMASAHTIGPGSALGAAAGSKDGAASNTAQAIGNTGGMVHVGTPPRVGGRGTGFGRRGAGNGLDSRGLPIPDYPAESRRRNEEGLVQLDVEILPNGTVGDVKIVLDSGYSRLNNAAIEAVRQAVFQPATFDGIPVTAHLTIPYRFILN